MMALWYLNLFFNPDSSGVFYGVRWKG